MILMAILFTWYTTKLYYTGKFKLDFYDDLNDNVKVVCASCSRYYWVNRENRRSPDYCPTCK